MMRSVKPAMRSAVAVAILSLLSSAMFLTAGPAHADKKAPALAGPSKAITDDTIDAIAAEIERAVVMLRIPGELPPYFINHKLTEVDVNDVVASLGSTTYKRNRHFVSLDGRVHVGSYDDDNSNFVAAGLEGTDGWANMLLPMEATPRIASRVAWLVTDAAYKEALEQMRAKTDTLRAGGLGSSSQKSYSKQPPVVQDEPIEVPALEDLNSLEARAQKISQLFRGQPHVRDSRVAFTSFLERRWYLNNEGTRAHDTRRVSGVVIAVAGQADDGQELTLYYTRYGRTAADLPNDKVLEAEAAKLSATLDQLRKAPMMDNYTGPVLFEGQGAADIVRYTLAPHLGGTPLPEGYPASEAKLFGGGLNDRNKDDRVLSTLLTVVDDPTASAAEGKALIGGYRFDDEGVPAQRVAVIENGRLVNLLTSRTPSAKFPASNGHARRSAPGGVYHGSATNLMIHSKRGVNRQQLVRQLLAEAREQGLPYAMIIRSLDDPAATALPEMAMREILQLLKSADRSEPPVAALAYKVYPDGREELVRGVQLRPVDVRAWRDVIAVGNKPVVFNYLASGELPLSHKLQSVGSGEVPSSGVESAVVTPALLFEELDVIGSPVGRRALPLVSRPDGR